VLKLLCGEYNVTGLRQLRYVTDDAVFVLRFISDNKISSGGFRAVYSTEPSKGESIMASLFVYLFVCLFVCLCFFCLLFGSGKRSPEH
jgi:hypothetical protein